MNWKSFQFIIILIFVVLFCRKLLSCLRPRPCSGVSAFLHPWLSFCSITLRDNTSLPQNARIFPGPIEEYQIGIQDKNRNGAFKRICIYIINEVEVGNNSGMSWYWGLTKYRWCMEWQEGKERRMKTFQFDKIKNGRKIKENDDKIKTRKGNKIFILFPFILYFSDDFSIFNSNSTQFFLHEAIFKWKSSKTEGNQKSSFPHQFFCRFPFLAFYFLFTSN